MSPLPQPDMVMDTMTAPEPPTDITKEILAVLYERRMMSYEKLMQELGGSEAVHDGLYQLIRSGEVGMIGLGSARTAVAAICPDCLDLRHRSALRRRWCGVRRTIFGGPFGRPGGFRNPLEKYSVPPDI